MTQQTQEKLVTINGVEYTALNNPYPVLEGEAKWIFDRAYKFAGLDLHPKDRDEDQTAAAKATSWALIQLLDFNEEGNKNSGRLFAMLALSIKTSFGDRALPRAIYERAVSQGLITRRVSTASR